jgi:hypothetical protein
MTVSNQKEFTVKSVKTFTTGVVLALSLIGVSSAMAANWHPQNANITATQEGTGYLDSPSGSLDCIAGSTVLRASGAVATTVDTINQIAFSACNGLGGATTVTTFGDWHFIATSTTAVDIIATPTASTNKVATIHIPSFGCDLTITGTIHIPGNTWSNANHT